MVLGLVHLFFKPVGKYKKGIGLGSYSWVNGMFILLGGLFTLSVVDWKTSSVLPLVLISGMKGIVALGGF